MISIEIKENETPHLELSLFKDIEIFTGDINIDILDQGKNQVLRNDYLNMLSSHGFNSFINCTTRRGNGEEKESCLDHIFICNRTPYNIEAAVIDYEITDHLPIFCNIFENKSELEDSNSRS